MKHILSFCLGLLLLFNAPIYAAPTQKNFAAPRALPAQTLKQVRAILASPSLANGHVGVEIRALGRVETTTSFPSKSYSGGAQPILFSQNATRRFLPASNVKLFTAALALRALGEAKTFTTTVASTRAAQNGVIEGDIRLVGGGDPSLESADIERLAQAVAARGVRRISGDVVGDGRAFGGETFGARYPDGWTLDDALWYYGPEISALAVNRNQIDVTLTGASTRGAPATLKIDPPSPGHFRIVALVVTGASAGSAATGSLGETGALRFDRADASSVLGAQLSVRGNLRPGQVVTEGVAVPDAPRWAAQIFRDALLRNGVAVGGVARSATPSEREYSHLESRNETEPEESGSLAKEDVRRHADGLRAMHILAHHESAPLGILLQRFLKNSDNLYGEILLRDAALFGDTGLQKGAPVNDLAARGHFMLRRFLAENGIASNDLRFTDGAGLSRYNLLTPRATTQLLTAMQKMRGGAALWDALPIAGVDGTLRKRMASTRARGNVRAKTGTFSIASALSGYVTTQDGDLLAVSILTNFCEGNAARAAQNALFSALAESRRPVASTP